MRNAIYHWRLRVRVDHYLLAQAAGNDTMINFLFSPGSAPWVSFRTVIVGFEEDHK